MMETEKRLSRGTVSSLHDFCTGFPVQWNASGTMFRVLPPLKRHSFSDAERLSVYDNLLYFIQIQSEVAKSPEMIKLAIA